MTDPHSGEPSTLDPLPPFVFPDSRILAGSHEYRTAVPFEHLLDKAAGIVGVVSGLDRSGAAWLTQHLAERHVTCRLIVVSTPPVRPMRTFWPGYSVSSPPSSAKKSSAGLSRSGPCPSRHGPLEHQTPSASCLRRPRRSSASSVAPHRTSPLTGMSQPKSIWCSVQAWSSLTRGGTGSSGCGRDRCRLHPRLRAYLRWFRLLAAPRLHKRGRTT